MPAKRTARTRKESKQLIALAFNDAVRDILHADGKFHLGDDRSRDAVWEWDGARWRRVPLVDPRADQEPPVVEVGDEEDFAVAG